MQSTAGSVPDPVDGLGGTKATIPVEEVFLASSVGENASEALNETNSVDQTATESVNEI